MASWLTCSLCGVVREIGIDQPMPMNWRPTNNGEGILCPGCVKDSGLESVARDISAVLKETARGLEQLRKDREVPPEIMLMPMDAPAREYERATRGDDTTLDEDACDVCRGPCQGH